MTPPVKKTNGKRNRNAGHAWERENVESFRVFFPHVATSRSCNRTRDAEKVDLAYPDEHKLGRFPYNVQSKNYSTSIPYPKLLAEMPAEDGIINVILHKQTENTGSRFITRGKFALLGHDDFFKLVAFRQAFLAIQDYIDFVPDKERAELDKTLKQLGL